MNMGRSIRNETLDAVKGVACILVVFMHCEFPGLSGVAVQTVSRWCVPFFFMISGYYCCRESQAGTLSALPGKIKRVLAMAIGATAFYLVAAAVSGQSFSWTSRQVFLWAVLNQPPFLPTHIWFLFALLYVYLLHWAVVKSGFQNVFLRCVPLFCVLYVVLAQGAYLAGVKIPNCYYRNFLIEGCAFFGGGMLVKKHFGAIGFSDRTLCAIAVLSTVGALFERWLIGRDFGVQLCSFPQVFAIFLLAQRHPGERESLLSRFGRECSMLVYILHPFVWHSTEYVYGMLSLQSSTAAMWLLPIVVVVLTILLVLLLNAVKVRAGRRYA